MGLRTMRNTYAFVLALAFAGGAIVAFTPAAHAVNPPQHKLDAYDKKKAECQRAAKDKHFGRHLIKRDRWIKNCIAGERT